MRWTHMQRYVLVRHLGLVPDVEDIIIRLVHRLI
jgi:hypothetical protein